MHPIDEAILDGTLTQALLDEHAAKPLPPVGHSYWGDCMREWGMNPLVAAMLAGNEMNDALCSITAVA